MGRRRLDVGALVFGALPLLVGGCYLLTNTFGVDLPELDWDKLWPVALIVLGVAVVAGAVASRSRSDQG